MNKEQIQHRLSLSYAKRLIEDYKDKEISNFNGDNFKRNAYIDFDKVYDKYAINVYYDSSNRPILRDKILIDIPYLFSENKVASINKDLEFNNKFNLSFTNAAFISKFLQIKKREYEEEDRVLQLNLKLWVELDVKDNSKKVKKEKL